MKGHLTKKIEDELNKNYPCYVVVTCSPPSSDGKIQVELSYQGDAALAAYIIQGAQSYFDDLEIDSES